MKLAIVTGNANKVAQIAKHLEHPIEQIDVDLPEIQAVRVEDVIEAKAREAFRQVRRPVIVEDTGLAFEAWNGLPGALIKWFLESMGNEGICKMLNGFDNRRVVAQTCIGFYDGDASGSEFVAFSGFASGVVPVEPRGTLGFGWDAIFQPEGSTKTFAEMTPDEVRTVDMRRDAALGLKGYLDHQNLRLAKQI